mmetsp:Transcript_29075/g.32292  ORF Transcript_29075/g.32292 Transcript_29075/m.32292 type:complete len:154 (-) Transcript_29075:795-1256(-)
MHKEIGSEFEPIQSGAPDSPTSLQTPPVRARAAQTRETSNSKTGRPIKHPRPADCPHLDRPEHKRGVCYQCSSNIGNKKRRRDDRLSNAQGDGGRGDGGYGHAKRRKIARGHPDIVELNIGGEVLILFTLFVEFVKGKAPQKYFKSNYSLHTL